LKKKLVSCLICVFLAFTFMSSQVGANLEIGASGARFKIGANIIKLKKREHSQIIMNGEKTTYHLKTFFYFLQNHGFGVLKIGKDDKSVVLLSAPNDLFIFDSISEQEYPDDYSADFALKVHFKSKGDEYVGSFGIGDLRGSKLVHSENFLKHDSVLEFLKNMIPGLTCEDIIQINITAFSIPFFFKNAHQTHQVESITAKIIKEIANIQKIEKEKKATEIMSMFQKMEQRRKGEHEEMLIKRRKEAAADQSTSKKEVLGSLIYEAFIEKGASNEKAVSETNRLLTTYTLEDLIAMVNSKG